MSTLEFSGKTAIITGAASGMGEVTVRMLVERGANVMMLDVNEKRLRELESELGEHVCGRVTDVRKYEELEAAVQATVERFGRVDITVSYAGGSAGRVCKDFHDFNDLSLQTIDWGIDVNFRAPIYLAHCVYNRMREQGGGVIINIGSIDGVTGARGAADYSAAKSGLIGFTKSIAQMGAKHGIRCCCVSPGPVLTRENMANMRTPMLRAGKPEEIVNVVLFLCSDKASFITGVNYLVDGGRACGAEEYPQPIV